MIPANAKPMFLINLLKLNPLNNKHLLNLIKFNGLFIENEQDWKNTTKFNYSLQQFAIIYFKFWKHLKSICLNHNNNFYLAVK